MVLLGQQRVPIQDGVSRIQPTVEAEVAWDFFVTDSSQWCGNQSNKKNAKYFDVTTANSCRVERKPGTGNLVGACQGSYRTLFEHGTDHEKPSRPQEHSQVDTGSNSFDKRQLIEAVEALDSLVQRGSYVDNSVFYSILKRCTAQKDLLLGSRVHALSVKSGYECNPFLANHIIRMYASHWKLEEAVEVFTKVPTPNCFMWAAIILAHARHGQPREAIRLYQQMRESTVKPDDHIFVAVLKACASAKDLPSGRNVHADILEAGDKANIIVGNCLVYMYSKCGSLDDARRVFDSLSTRNVVTWNAMIAGYAQNGLGRNALDLYGDMQHESNLLADAVTFVSLLQACATITDLHRGKQLHVQIRERRLEANVVVGNSLVNMYAKCGSLEDARKVFENLPTRDVVTWNAMIAGYAKHGLGQEALTLYGSMQQEGITPADAVTFVCLLQACGSVAGLEKGKEIHAQISMFGLEATNLFVANALIDMYSKCGSLEDARKVFNNLFSRDVVTWTAMIGGYALHGLGQDALALYASMQQEDITPTDSVTFVCLLQAFANLGALRQGKQLHTQIQERGLELDVMVGTCLVDMYAKCGSLDDARRVFSNLQCKTVVTWTAMIAACAQDGFGQEALALYENMQQEGIIPTSRITFISLLQACGSVAGLEKGKQIHDEIIRSGVEPTDLFVANALVDMYGKCGCMADAQQVFDAVHLRNIVTWNALIAGYARQGESELVFHFFHRMKQEGIQPNSVTFLSILTVCSHVGLVDYGHTYFEAMRRDYSIPAAIEHYTCMVDLLGRAGQVNKAVQTIRMMPFPADSVVWRCVLGACRKWRNVDLGRHAFESAMKLDKRDAAAYILMANIYAAAQMPEAAKDIQTLRVRTKAWKKPGQSWWTDMAGVVHTFVVGDKQHPEWQHIDAKLKYLCDKMKVAGYVPRLASVLRDIPEDEKEAALCEHSEKLAIAFALHKTTEGSTIRVVKNLRVCEDCHAATALISKVEQRTIICRDASRFHVFKDGKCTCGDYW